MTTEKKKSGGGQLIENATRKTIFMVDVEDLSVYPDWHPRSDERKAYKPDPAMVANVKLRGIQKPLRVEVLKAAQAIVGTDGEERELPPGTYIVDGHQRYGWARAAAAELRKEGEPGAQVQVPVWPISGDDDYLGSLSIALNRHVEDDPMVTARKLRVVYDRLGGDLKRTATETGYTTGFVKQHIALVSLAPKVQRAVADGKLSVGSAFDLSKLDPAEQVKQLTAAEQIAGEGDGRRRTTVTRKALKQARGAQDSARPSRREIRARLEALEQGDTPADRIRAAELRWVLTGKPDNE